MCQLGLPPKNCSTQGFFGFRFASASRSLPVSWGDSWLTAGCERCHAMVPKMKESSPSRSNYERPKEIPKRPQPISLVRCTSKLRTVRILWWKQDLMNSLKTTVAPWTDIGWGPPRNIIFQALIFSEGTILAASGCYVISPFEFLVVQLQVGKLNQSVSDSFLCFTWNKKTVIIRFFRETHLGVLSDLFES